MPGTISALVYSLDSTDEYADPEPVEVTTVDANLSARRRAAHGARCSAMPLIHMGMVNAGKSPYF